MAYRFKLKEDLRDGVRRIAVEQMERALAAPHADSDRIVWVHETRKALKRTRSLLRCVRDALGDQRWRAENAALREIAVGLSTLRDRDVVHQTLTELTASGDADLAAALVWLETRFASETQPKADASDQTVSATIAEAREALEKARHRLSRLSVDGELPDLLALGLTRCQRAGRKALARLVLDPSEENLHELRKSVQTFQRQHTLAQAVWPEAQAVRIETARACAQMLGKAQDLAVLSGMVKALRGRSRRERALADRILVTSRARQVQLREAVLPRVARLLAPKPKAMAGELITCWRAAVAMSAAGVEAPPRHAVGDAGRNGS